jgi:hypothetical protein
MGWLKWIPDRYSRLAKQINLSQTEADEIAKRMCDIGSINAISSSR